MLDFYPFLESFAKAVTKSPIPSIIAAKVFLSKVAWVAVVN